MVLNTTSGDLYYYRHKARPKSANDFETLNPQGTPTYRVNLSKGFKFKHLTMDDKGYIYWVDDKLDLYIAKFQKQPNGFAGFEMTSKKIGAGWNFSKVLSGGNGILYAIDAKGDLYYYEHYPTSKDEKIKWVHTKELIGTQWNKFKHVVAGRQRVLYAVDSQNKILYYKHRVYWDKVDKQWDVTSRTIGTLPPKTADFIAGGTRDLYVVLTDGTLHYFRHKLDPKENEKWEVNPTKIGSSWSNYLFVLGL